MDTGMFEKVTLVGAGSLARRNCMPIMVTTSFDRYCRRRQNATSTYILTARLAWPSITIIMTHVPGANGIMLRHMIQMKKKMKRAFLVKCFSLTSEAKLRSVMTTSLSRYILIGVRDDLIGRRYDIYLGACYHLAGTFDSSGGREFRRKGLPCLLSSSVEMSWR